MDPVPIQKWRWNWWQISFESWNFKCFHIDLHSYSQLVMYPYGYRLWEPGDAVFSKWYMCFLWVLLQWWFSGFVEKVQKLGLFPEGPVFSLCSLQCAIRPTGNRKRRWSSFFLCLLCEFKVHTGCCFPSPCLSDQNVLQIHCSSGTVWAAWAGGEGAPHSGCGPGGAQCCMQCFTPGCEQDAWVDSWVGLTPAEWLQASLSLLVCWSAPLPGVTATGLMTRCGG